MEIQVPIKIISNNADPESIDASIISIGKDNILIQVDGNECIVAEISHPGEYPNDRRVVKILVNTVSRERFSVSTEYLTIEPIEDGALTEFFGASVS